MHLLTGNLHRSVEDIAKLPCEPLGQQPGLICCQLLEVSRSFGKFRGQIAQPRPTLFAAVVPVSCCLNRGVHSKSASEIDFSLFRINNLQNILF